MLYLLFAATSIFRLEIDIVRQDGLEQLSCYLIEVNDSLVDYHINQKKLSASIDCVTLFHDSFED